MLDYLSHWLQLKKKQINESRMGGSRATVNSMDFDEIKEIGQISSVDLVLSAIPPDILAQRAMDCRSFPRALFHWEQYLREEQDKGRMAEGSSEQEEVLHHLQEIYAQIDEPDGIEGISAHLHVLDPEQQILDHKKNGRWTAAQSWYELELLDDPTDSSAQLNLLTCLRESGQSGNTFRLQIR